eukprot:Polyplicarium_translucidae@DN3163_c0_g2_i2.p1
MLRTAVRFQSPSRPEPPQRSGARKMQHRCRLLARLHDDFPYQYSPVAPCASGPGFRANAALTAALRRIPLRRSPAVHSPSLEVAHMRYTLCNVEILRIAAADTAGDEGNSHAWSKPCMGLQSHGEEDGLSFDSGGGFWRASAARMRDPSRTIELRSALWCPPMYSALI